MNNFKLVIYVSIVLLVSSCNFKPPMVSAQSSDAITHTDNSILAGSQSEDEELRNLVETSDLIIIGTMKEARPLVDPEKRKKEYEATRGSLAQPKKYMFGYLYKVSANKIIRKTKDMNIAESVSIYSEGEIFTMHSNLVRLLEGREYLIFLSRAKKEDINNQFRTSNSKGFLSTDQIDYKEVFLVTNGFYGLRETKDKPDLVTTVEKLAQKKKK